MRKKGGGACGCVCVQTAWHETRGPPLCGGAEVLDTVVSRQYFLSKENVTFTSGAKFGFRTEVSTNKYYL